VPVSLCGPGIPLTFQPDYIWNYEIGEKARLLNNRLSINADVFYIDWHNVQQTLTIPTCGYPYNANAGNARSYGPELEISGTPVPDWTFAIHGTYTRSYLASVGADVQGFLVASNQPLEPGTPLQNVPRYTVGGAIGYDHQLSSGLKLTARLDDTYVGWSYDLAYLFQQIPGYNLADFRLGLAGDRWSVTAFVRNLTNKVAWLSTNTTTISINIPPLTRVSTNQPRTAGIELRYSF
jgi:outer membrane receptor protein involved in Fe transport